MPEELHEIMSQPLPGILDRIETIAKHALDAATRAEKAAEKAEAAGVKAAGAAQEAARAEVAGVRKEVGAVREDISGLRQELDTLEDYVTQEAFAIDIAALAAKDAHVKNSPFLTSKQS